MARQGYVYILASRRRGTLYVGVTSDLDTRLAQHRAGTGSAFVRRYRIDRLVHVETYEMITDAIAREKQLKAWRRARKIALIETANPAWHDLAHDLP